MDYDYSQAVASSTGSNVGSIMSTVLTIAGFWFLFVKANEDGWKAIIPFYNLYTAFDIVYGNGLKALMLLIPIFNIAVIVMFYYRLAEVFGKSKLICILTVLFSPIMLLVIAFTPDSSYRGPCDKFI
ncbi:MAG: hypothetical protein IJ906_09640 [Oscillospiraceae bacterium]|jgi:hypothetical protein|nr:hypothetical protein [Oscillospiraceae bacterium]